MPRGRNRRIVNRCPARRIRPGPPTGNSQNASVAPPTPGARRPSERTPGRVPSSQCEIRWRHKRRADRTKARLESKPSFLRSSSLRCTRYLPAVVSRFGPGPRFDSLCDTTAYLLCPAEQTFLDDHSNIALTVRPGGVFHQFLPGNAYLHPIKRKQLNFTARALVVHFCP